MLVDDEENILNSFHDFLSDHGYVVNSFRDGSSALAAFQENPGSYDIVITDMTMPKITGDKLSIEILKICPNMPIILCTGYSEKMSKEKVREIGICKYLSKPVRLFDFIKIIREILDAQ